MDNFTVVITRPEHQAQNLSALIRQQGGIPIILPSITIKPIGIEDKLNHISTNPDIVIFTSANSVIHSKPFWNHAQPQITAVAIGPGTAKALQHLGLLAPLIPADFSSEGLLKLPCLTRVDSKNIFIFCGKNPRPLLQQTLQQRHASVTLLECYQRLPAKPAANLIAKLSDSRPDLSITTSQETLLNFYRIIQEQNINWLLEIPLLVTNAKHTKVAHELGFKKVIASKNATDSEIISTIKSVFGMPKSKSCT